jgi:hypothetical protein
MTSRGCDTESKDEFSNPDRFRVNQNFTEQLGAKKIITEIQVRRPDKQWWVRTHQELQLNTFIIEDSTESETYLAEPDLWPALANEGRLVTLFGSINRQGLFFIWPIPLPGSDGRTNSWHAAARAGAIAAQTEWTRIAANMETKCYDVSQATAKVPPPEWPALSLKQMLRLAFKDRFIRDMEHPLVRRLREGA